MEPKFIYNQKVIIVKGFYKGQTGVVKKGYYTKHFFSPNEFSYMVSMDFGPLEYIPEENLQSLDFVEKLDE